MKNFVFTITLALICSLALSACSFSQLTSPWPAPAQLTCYDRVAIADDGIAVAAEQAESFLAADIIDVHTAETVSGSLKLAAAAVDNAKPFCGIDDAKAYQ